MSPIIMHVAIQLQYLAIQYSWLTEFDQYNKASKVAKHAAMQLVMFNKSL